MNITDKLRDTKNLTDSELLEILGSDKYDLSLFSKADEVRKEIYKTDVYIRGLIEFTNYCKNDCFYCGIRKSNSCCRALQAFKKRNS